MNKYDDFVIDRSNVEERKLMKYIARHDMGRTWAVRINNRKLRARKCFSDKKYGGTWMALSEAISYRDRMLRRIRNKEKKMVREARAIMLAQRSTVSAPKRSTRSGRVKLTDAEVREIRASDMKISDLATIFGASLNGIRQIIRGERRANVQ